MSASLQYGIDALVEDHGDWLEGRRIGLVAHPASVGAKGALSAELIRAQNDTRLACLFGPEHGVAGKAGAGEAVADAEHPDWRIPVHSLYGDTRRPTAEMLEGIDTIVFDLQDLSCRPYTYVSTLRYVLEAAAEFGKSVVVADRPTPLANVVDGPVLDPRFESFVGCVRAPLVYGMTPGEMAIWIQRDLKLDVDLNVAEMKGYHRAAARPAGWPPWIPPSPAVKSWECGLCFPVTVLFEALPGLDHGRGTAMAFQVFGAPWLDGPAAADTLTRLALPGVRFRAEAYKAAVGAHKGKDVRGVRIEVTDASAFKPVLTGLTIIEIVQDLHGPAWLWSQHGTRPEFFDQLLGTDRARLALFEGLTAPETAGSWDDDLRTFRGTREPCLLYKG